MISWAYNIAENRRLVIALFKVYFEIFFLSDTWWFYDKKAKFSRVTK